MKKTIILILACVCIAASASAQRGSGHLSLGVGLLYKNGMDATLATNTRSTTVMRGNFSPTATCNGPNAPRANISARIHSGATIAPTASVWPTSLCHPGTQPLRQPAHRCFGRERHPEVPRRSAFRLRTQLCAASRMDTLLAGKERCDDKRCGRTTGRCRAGCETACEIREHKKRKLYDTKITMGGSGNNSSVVCCL